MATSASELKRRVMSARNAQSQGQTTKKSASQLKREVMAARNPQGQQMEAAFQSYRNALRTQGQQKRIFDASVAALAVEQAKQRPVFGAAASQFGTVSTEKSKAAQHMMPSMSEPREVLAGQLRDAAVKQLANDKLVSVDEYLESQSWESRAQAMKDAGFDVPISPEEFAANSGLRTGMNLDKGNIVPPKQMYTPEKDAFGRDRAEYVANRNQEIIDKNFQTLASVKMDGTSHSILEELNEIAKLEDGAEKDTRKNAVISTMEKLGISAEDYALYSDDSNFNWETFWNWAGSAANAGLAGFTSGIASTGDVLLGKPLEALGWSDNPFSVLADTTKNEQALSQYNQDLYAQRLGGGKGYEYGGMLINAITGALPDAALAVFLGWLNTATPSSNQLIQNAAYEAGDLLTRIGLKAENMMSNPQYWTSFSRTLGQDYEEAKAMGADDYTAALGSVFTSLVNAGIEIGTDGMSGIQGLPQELAEGGENKLLSWVISSLEEGGEEGLQKFVNEMTGKFLYGSNNKVLDPSEYALEMGLGTATGLAMGGGQIAAKEAINTILGNKTPSQAEQTAGGDVVQLPTDMSGAKYSIRQTQTIPYSQQLQQIENGKSNGSNSLYIGEPSETMQAAGFSGAPFAMNQSDYRKSRRTQGNNKNYSSHAVSYAFFENMPQHLSEAPMLIDNGDKVTVITDYAMKDTKGNDSYVIAGVWKNQKMETDTVNQVKSVYPLDNISAQITKAAEQGTLVALNKDKAEQMLATIGVQPSEVSRIVSLAKDSVSQNTEAVNTADSSAAVSSQRSGTQRTAQNSAVSQAVGNVISDPVAARELAQTFDPQRQSAYAFGEGIKEAYMYGKNGFTVQEMLSRGSFVHDLIDGQIDKAYTLGQRDGGKGRFANYRSKQAGIQRSYLATELQKKASKTYRAVDRLAKALGMQVQITEMDEYGMYRNGVMELSSKLLESENVGQAVTTVVYHEVTHRIQEVAPKLYATYRHYALEQFANPEAAIERYQKAYAENEQAKKQKDATYQVKQLSRFEAMDEMAADYTRKLMEQTELFREFVTQGEEYRTIGQRLKDFLKQTVQKLQMAFAGHTDADAAEVSDKLKKLREGAALWEQALAEAKETVKHTPQQQAKPGSKAKASISPSYAREVDAWYSNGMPNGEWFVLGSTGPVLQGLGAIESDIFINGDKIKQIFEAHPEMGLREIQRIPEILEDPVLILKSKNKVRSQYGNSRIAVFGTIKAKDGNAIMCIMDLRPVENGFLLDDMQKVNSAYTKNTNPVQFVEQSEVVHADKKRTIPLLRGMGFRMPMSLLRDGSVGSISYSGQSVNISGEKFSTVVSDNAKDGQYSIPGTEDILEQDEKRRELQEDSGIQNQYEGVNLSTDGEVYTYEFLTSLPDMQVVTLPELENIRTDGRIDTKKVVEAGMKNARSVGTERDGKVFVKNRYTGVTLRINANTIRHGLNGNTNRLLTNARLGAIIGEVVRHAVPINALHNKVEGVTGTYAMVQYATDSNGREFIAVVTVEQKTQNISDIEVYDVVHALSGRQKNSSQASTKLQSINSIKAATKTIAEVLEVVKSTHQSILPVGVLEHLGETRNPKGDYADKVKFSLPGTEDILEQDEKQGELQEDIGNIPALVRMTTADGKPVQFLPSQMNKLAAALKEKNSLVGRSKELNAHLESFFRFLYSGAAITEQNIRAAAQPAVDWMLEHHQAPADPEAKEILDAIKCRSVRLDDTQRAEAEFLRGSYADYRKSLKDIVKISDEGTPLDIAWQELSEEYPYYFDAGATASDMPRLLLETIEQLKDARMDDGYWQAARQEVRENLFNQVYDAFWQVSTVSTAEAYQKMLDEAEDKLKNRPKRITVGMSDSERMRILQGKRIRLIAQTDPGRLNDSAMELEYIKESERKRILKKLGEEFGIFKEYSNQDIQISFDFSRGNLDESEKKQGHNYSDLQKMLTCFEDVINAAIGIEVHNRNAQGYKYDPTLKNVYVLVSAFEDGDRIIPVKLEVKEFADKHNTLHVAVALESIKKDEVVKEGDTRKGVTQASRSSEISVAYLLRNINPTDKSFLKYVPAQLLNTIAVEEDARRELQRITAQHNKLMKRLEAPEAYYQERYERKEASRQQRSIKAELRDKIKRRVWELSKLAERGTKERNVKDGLQEFARAALQAARGLYLYTERDMIRNGVELDLDNEQQEQFARGKEILETLDEMQRPDKETDPQAHAKWEESRKELRHELSGIMESLRNRQVFEREYKRIQSVSAGQLVGELQRAYKALEQTEVSYLQGAYQEQVYGKLGQVAEQLKGKPLKDMTIPELQMLHDMYAMVLHTVRQANKTFALEKKQNINELGDRIIDEITNQGKQREQEAELRRKLMQYGWNNLTVPAAVACIGSDTLQMLTDSIRSGEDIWAVDMADARAYCLKLQDKCGASEWDLGQTMEFLDKRGRKFEITLGQLMSLYAYLKRENAHKHLDIGGFVQDKNIKVQKKGKLGIPLEYYNTSAKTYKLGQKELEAVTSKLTPQQRQYVDGMVQYLSSTMGDKGNETSMKLYGIKLFAEKNYFPLRSEKQYMYEATELANGESKIKNQGFTKKQDPGANNPVVLSDFNQVCAEHIDRMALYHGVAPALEDFDRVFNYQQDIKLQGASGVRAAMQNRFGGHPETYLRQWLQDLNGGIRKDSAESGANALLSKFKKSAVMASLSVVIQQPSAIGRALKYIDARYLFGGKLDYKTQMKQAEEMRKYNPVAIIKQMGGFDTGVGQSNVDYLTKADPIGWGKVKSFFAIDPNYRDQVLGYLPGKADEVTWTWIWIGAKRQTLAENSGIKAGSEEHLQAAAKIFTKTIVNTQVYDSVMTKSGMMRSKGLGAKMITQFAAEPTVSASMVIQGIAEKGQGKKGWGRGIRAVYTSVLINSVLSSFIYAMRDDDEDKAYWEKYLKNLTTELLDGINPMTYFPLIRDVWSLLQGFEIGRSDMELISGLTDSATKLVKAYTSENSTEEQIWKGWWNLFDYLSSFAGLPVKNIRREILAVRDTISGLMAGKTSRWAGVWDSIGEAAMEWVPLTKLSLTKADKFMSAIKSGDSKYIQRFRNGYATEEGFYTAVSKAVRSKFEDGKIETEDALNILQTYGGMSEVEAKSKTQYWQYGLDYPDADLNEKTVSKYVEKLKPSGIELEEYLQFRADVAEIMADRDEDGEVIPGTKKDKVVAQIAGMDLNKKQKDALYLAEGYSEDGLKDTPWH